jgi:Activator of Hsp90 ATPase homolog 1-like protein
MASRSRPHSTIHCQKTLQHFYLAKVIYGRNVELIPNERVIQALRRYRLGVYSIARFELKKQGSGTRVTLDHTGFPEGSYDHLYVGWKGHYWEPLRKYLRSN